MIRKRVNLKDLDPKVKGNIFRSLVNNTYLQAGIEAGLDKSYVTTNGMVSAIKYIYNEVRADPQKFFIHPDTADLVIKAVDGRKVFGGKEVGTMNKPTLAEVREKEENRTISDLVLEGRNKAMRILNNKLERISSSRKKLDNVAVGELAKVAGILFDKGQIIQGQATENVAVLAKIDNDMSPEKALETLLKMREVEVASKQKNN